MTVKIYIEPPHHANSRGPCYRAHLASSAGEILVESSTQPFLDAARVLLARGYTGTAELWDSERPYARMRGKIEQLAMLNVTEGNRPPRFNRWRPFAGVRGVSKTAESNEEVGRAGFTEKAAKSLAGNHSEQGQNNAI
jgi:hypothetical protein